MATLLSDGRHLPTHCHVNTQDRSIHCIVNVALRSLMCPGVYWVSLDEHPSTVGYYLPAVTIY